MITINLLHISDSDYSIPEHHSYEECAELLKIKSRTFYLLQEKVKSLEARLNDQSKNLYEQKKVIEKQEKTILKQKLVEVQSQNVINSLKEHVLARDSRIKKLDEELLETQDLNFKKQFSEMKIFLDRLGLTINNFNKVLEGGKQYSSTLNTLYNNFNFLNQSSEKFLKEVHFPSSSVFFIPTTQRELLGLNGMSDHPETIRKSKHRLLKEIHPDKLQTNVVWIKKLFTELTKTVNMYA